MYGDCVVNSVFIDSEDVRTDFHYVLLADCPMLQVDFAGCRHAIASWRDGFQGWFVYEYPLVDGELRFG